MRKNTRRSSDVEDSLAVTRVSNRIAREFSPPPSRIPRAKWQEILEDDGVSQVVGFVREEIVRLAENAIYEGSLRRAAYGFVVTCAYEAWMRAFEWAHLRYDDEEISDWRPEEIPSPVHVKSPRFARGVPTVYGRLDEILITSEKLSSLCKAACAKSVSRRKNKRELQ